MIAIKYEGIPKESPLFKGVEHSAEGSFSELDINVNRTTLAVLLRFTNELTQELSTISFGEPQQQQQQQVVAVPAAVVAPTSESVVFRMKFGLSAIRLSLIKEQKNFIQVALQKAFIDFDLNGDGGINMDLSLGSLSVKDFYETHWSYLLSTGKSPLVYGFCANTLF